MFAARCEVGGARFEKTRMDDPDVAEVGFGSFACDVRHGRAKAELADGLN
jgi:hypothetical protein